MIFTNAGFDVLVFRHDMDEYFMSLSIFAEIFYNVTAIKTAIGRKLDIRICDNSFHVFVGGPVFQFTYVK